MTRGVTLGGNSSAIATALLLATDPRAAALSSLSMSLFGTAMVALTSVPPVVRVVKSLVGLERYRHALTRWLQQCTAWGQSCGDYIKYNAILMRHSQSRQWRGNGAEESSYSLLPQCLISLIDLSEGALGCESPLSFFKVARPNVLVDLC